jgi:phospholipid/cholesterol/gamma-HCH transport system substrate-binding protein/paraquat-inducible protein B
MDDKQYYLRLGLFVVLSAAILFAVLFILGAKSLFQPSLNVETYFSDSVAGLEVGAPVKWRGVQVGEVTGIDLSTTLYEPDVPVAERKGYIVVRVKVVGARAPLWRKELDAYVQRGMRVRTQLAGITGEQYLALDFFDPQKHRPLPFGWKPDYPYVPSAPSLTSQIVASVQNLVSSLDKAEVEHLARNLNALVVTLNKKVDQLPVTELSADANALLQEARAAIHRVDRLLAQAPIEETLRSLASASVRIDRLLADPGLDQTVGNAAAITGRLRKVAEGGELDRAANKLHLAIQRVDALLADNQYDIRGAVQDLRVTVSNLRTLSETAKRYPPGLLVGGPPEKVQLRNESRKESK